MMIGGIVVAIEEMPDRLTLEVRDQSRPDRCKVDVAKGYLIEFGDSVWWQGDYVYWTPAGMDHVDVPGPRLGYARATKVE